MNSANSDVLTLTEVRQEFVDVRRDCQSTLKFVDTLDQDLVELAEVKRYLTEIIENADNKMAKCQELINRLEEKRVNVVEAAKEVEQLYQNSKLTSRDVDKHEGLLFGIELNFHETKGDLLVWKSDINHAHRYLRVHTRPLLRLDNPD
ncbi:hypothetical protein GCM10009332_23870 [Shewanella gelidii]|uniref:Uncharacterized protein n=2 Tax=Shewanella gelidii TaxID=1642821 RepID=A0A917JWT0_9GAMM|nr:hypothetical protein GCM10009332_23870 [Shewanella gelidii]